MAEKHEAPFPHCKLDPYVSKLSHNLIFGDIRIECSAHNRANGAEEISPGQRPGFQRQSIVLRPEGAQGTTALSGREMIFVRETQGVAPGWHTPGLSAPEEIDWPHT
jgi:hypothetical protein